MSNSTTDHKMNESMKADDALLRAYAASKQDALVRIASAAAAATLNEPSPSKGKLVRLLAIPLGAAAALVIALTVFFGGSDDLYADVVRSLAEASSFRATLKDKAANGEWHTRGEVLYQREAGVRYTDQKTGRVRIDNFEYLWRYNPARKLALKTPSSGFAEEITADVLDLKEFADALDSPPIGEETFSGVHCEVYAMETGTYRFEILISPNDQRLRAFRDYYRNESEEWDLKQEALIEYDIAIDQDTMLANFGDDVTVLEPTNVAEAFKLEDALLTRDYFELQFALHAVQRINEGRLLVCTSTRPSEGLIERFGEIHSAHGDGSKVYGNHAVGTSFTRFAEGTHASFWPWEAAEVLHDGLQIKWTILTPVGDWPDDFANTLPLSVSIWTRGEVQKELKEAKEDWYFNNRLVDTFDLSEFEVSSLRSTLADVYDQILMLEAGAWRAVVNLQTKETDLKLPEDGRELTEIVSRKPSEVTFEVMSNFIEAELRAGDARILKQ